MDAVDATVTETDGEKAIDSAAAEKEEEEEDKTPPPPGNGMVLEKYSWTQQLADLEVVVPVPEGTRTKDLKVTSHVHMIMSFRLSCVLFSFVRRSTCPSTR